MAKVNGIPIVDLFNLYERINSGSHYTHDNVLVDPSYPGGNFYSSDGIHPSALGHAVITNEIIKTINEFYKLQIELISIKDFANN